MGAEAVTETLQLLLLLMVCTVLLLVAGLRVLAMYGEGSLSLAEIAIYGVLVVAAMGGTLGRWGTWSGGLLGIAFVALCLGVPMVRRIADRRLAAQLLREDIAECHRLLRFDPKNAAAHSRLGDVYARQGDLDAAVAEYQVAAELSPKDKIVQQALQRAIERKRRREVPSRFCPRCRTENPRGAIHCRECGTALNAWAELRHGLRQISPTQGLVWAAVVAGACLLLAAAGVILPRTATMLVGLSLALATALYLCVRPLR